MTQKPSQPARSGVEHFSTVLPFCVLEAMAQKPLRIRGVAICSGISRNHNIYTPAELESFRGKLEGAPVYVEHVAVPNAVGKVTKTEWDGNNLWYEAEIYDDEVAGKIRRGLIQHVSVGADYEAVDLVDGKVPHGLHNAELSLVAVPGFSETNVQVLESLKEQGIDPLVAGEYILGFYQNNALFLPDHYRTVWLDKANGVLALFGKGNVDPAREFCQAILFLKTKWQPNTVADWLKIHPDYLSSAGTAINSPMLGTMEGLSEEASEMLAEKVAAKLQIKSNTEVQELNIELSQTKSHLEAVQEKLSEANRTVEALNKRLPGGGLIVAPQVTMQVSEHLNVLQELLPPLMVQRSSLGMQRQSQAIKAAILNAQERLHAK